eukprot:234369_1
MCDFAILPIYKKFILYHISIESTSRTVDSICLHIIHHCQIFIISLIFSILLLFIYNYLLYSNLNYDISAQQFSNIEIDTNINEIDTFDLTSIGYNINTLNKQKTTIIIQSYCKHGDVNRMNILLYILARYRTYCLVIHDIVLIWGCNIQHINTKILQKIKHINESNIECKQPNSNSQYTRWYTPLNHTNLKPANIYIYVKKTSTLSHRWQVINFHKFNTLTAISQDDDYIFNELHFYCHLNAFNVLQFNVSDNKQKIFYLNDKIYSNNINIIGVLGHDTRHYFDINWNNKSEKQQWIREMNETIGINTMLEKRMWFTYSCWPNAPQNNYSFDILMPSTALIIPIYLYKIISDMFVKYNLIQIIDNQFGMCDDIAYTLALYYYFNGKTNNKLFLKYFNPPNYWLAKFYRDSVRDKIYFVNNKYPLIDMVLEEWENKYKNYNNSMNDKQYFFNMNDYELKSNDINDESINIASRLASRPFRLYYRHECINLMLWEYQKQHLDDMNFINSLNIHRHFEYNSRVTIPCFSQQDKNYDSP